MNKMKTVYKLVLVSLLVMTACENDLDQAPPNIASADSLEDFEGVLNAAYYYQLGAVTPMAVMGDFRADNAVMDEEPYPEFDRFGPDLTVMEDQFFRPFYAALYKSILSANNVIENSSNEMANLNIPFGFKANLWNVEEPLPVHKFNTSKFNEIGKNPNDIMGNRDEITGEIFCNFAMFFFQPLKSLSSKNLSFARHTAKQTSLLVHL